ncbi:hypothetical protein MKZ38_008713 [Zalerion maritima]|uniref:Uncharacterized protein n=1 Tax=Zalerion maritima TaxID=339359 RepID=A0AAD5RVP6_9PEZI|nr:hypothetical protein MKZ38_008713 [Zalerion maritima]
MISARLQDTAPASPTHRGPRLQNRITERTAVSLACIEQWCDKCYYATWHASTGSKNEVMESRLYSNTGATSSLEQVLAAAQFNAEKWRLHNSPLCYRSGHIEREGMDISGGLVRFDLRVGGVWWRKRYALRQDRNLWSSRGLN